MKRPYATGATGRQGGFTLIEVLVALVVFAISVIGLVAMESRSIESQKAGAEIRQGERIAQETMADLESQTFFELLLRDFEGSDNPSFPYDDPTTTAATRVVDYGRPPSDVDPSTFLAGSITGKYIVYRSVDLVTDAGSPPDDPPTLPADLVNIQGLAVEVVVMWIDDTNPAYPPPAGVKTEDLTPDMIDPSETTYSPYVGSVALRTIRINDTPFETVAP